MASRFTQPVEELNSRTAARSREFVEGSPVTSACIAFGVGLGLGVAIASLLSEALGREESTTERLGRQMLAAMSRVLPESVLRGMGA
jgi:hypothetical protein